MKHHVKRKKPNPFIVGLGAFLIMIGIAGLLLPLLQGVVIIFAGLSIIASQIHSVKVWLNRTKLILKEHFK